MKTFNEFLENKDEPPLLPYKPGDKHTLKLKRKPETNEWLVIWYTNGKRDEGKTYYTNDKQDAMETMKHMQAEADKASKL